MRFTWEDPSRSLASRMMLNTPSLTGLDDQDIIDRTFGYLSNPKCPGRSSGDIKESAIRLVNPGHLRSTP